MCLFFWKEVYLGVMDGDMPVLKDIADLSLGIIFLFFGVFKFLYDYKLIRLIKLLFYYKRVWFYGLVGSFLMRELADILFDISFLLASLRVPAIDTPIITFISYLKALGHRINVTFLLWLKKLFAHIGASIQVCREFMFKVVDFLYIRGNIT